MLSLKTICLVLFFACLPQLAHGAESERCIAAHEAGLDHERAFRLLAARGSFTSCSEETCPALVRGECSQKLAHLRRSIPSLVVRASGRGGDLSEATLRIDGEVVRRRLDGRPIELDPGPHRVTIETPEGSVSTSVVAQQGERDRVVTLELPAPAAREPAPAIHPAAWTLGGIGLSGLTVFAIAGGLGLAQENELERCAPACSPDAIEVMRTRYLVADVGLIVGGAGLIAAIVSALVLLPGDGDDSALVLGPGYLELRQRF